MESTAFVPDPRHLFWVKFWQQPWQEMDPSWSKLLPGTESLHWEALSPALVRQYLVLDADPPPLPGEVLLQWLSIGQERRSEALYLVAEVIRRGIGKARLHDEDIQWCRHIAKALMPGHWSVATDPDLNAEQIGLILMRQWMSPSTWQRARLFYSKSLLESVEAFVPDPVPGQRLNQLWHAVMWRLAEVPRPVDNPQEQLQEREEELCL
ncbi:hypothetical protein [Vibrio mangrovi]|uniref:Type III secretion protein n=1 Tax=Vibrio mangrovi TaxID=474394 RepID=A0A1Y6J1C3_9VIBR|nr:hypothetical protein [Vibrio mangrovi]MDW6001950.1 hypothetical protein [Vibrio mangrovi]SMS02502.1 hypothetical protein VIM7927_03835 [Vibrio mangrovi]